MCWMARAPTAIDRGMTLYDPIGVAVMSLIIGALFLRETKDEKVRLDL
mgnify:CR=1 FL=1